MIYALLFIGKISPHKTKNVTLVASFPEVLGGMIMKKLIAIAVVFALVAGGVFAADIGATVFGGVKLLDNGNGKKSAAVADDSKDKGAPLNGSGTMHRLRLEASGENDDGTFGAFIRLEDGSGFNGLAWWKPIDQFKMTIGGNPDGIFGKEGYSGWMFYQMPGDIDIIRAGNVWGGGYSYWPAIFRSAFYNGVDSNALLLEVKPVDMISLNIIFPYFNGGTYHNAGQTWIPKAGDVDAHWDADENSQGLKGIFNQTTVQLDINLDFGNIALTYKLLGDGGFGEVDATKVGQKVFLYFNLSAIDNLSLDLGVGYQIPYTYKYTVGKLTQSHPFSVGLAAKFDINDSFGLKARFLAQIGGNETRDWQVEKKLNAKTSLDFVADLLPYYGISDNIKIFLGLGIATHTPEWSTANKLLSALFPNDDDYKRGKTAFTWHVNPYVQVGAEWGPTFYAGVRVWSDSNDKTDNPNRTNMAKAPADRKKYTPIHVDIPIGIMVSF
jgi:opacity protein-like surface antigen